MKKIALAAARVVALLMSVFPWKLRHAQIFAALVLESRIGKPDAALRRLYQLHDDLERIIAERAMAHGGGVHPKHGLTRYHDFFVERIGAHERVLDIGCGYGAVARAIARAHPGATVAGIEIEADLIEQARAADNPANLSFILGDATKTLPDGPWTTVVLSNILEHLEDRVGFLKALLAAQKPRVALIRVPAFERSWHVPMRKELSMFYFNDRTHFIEHTEAEFRDEIAAAGLEITEFRTVWGEIWAACRIAPA